MNDFKLDFANGLKKEIKSLERTIKDCERCDVGSAVVLARFEQKIVLPALKEALENKKKEFEEL